MVFSQAIQAIQTIQTIQTIFIMKKIFLLTTSLFFTIALFAQDDQTLFSDVNRIGAFGGPLFDYTDLNGDVEATGGGGGAIVLDDFFLGGYGIGTYELSKSFTDTASINFREDVKFKHGGFWVGYVPVQHKVLHPYASLRIGWGKARYRKLNVTDDRDLDSINDNIFVLTPEAGFEINVFSFFRIAATAHYRLVNGVDKINNFSDSELSGFGGTLTLRFGGFGSEWD